MKPFENETDSEAIGGLTVENLLDRVTIYGSLDLTRDKAGLARAEQLKGLIDAAVAMLKATPNLPDAVPAKPTEQKKNPFA